MTRGAIWRWAVGGCFVFWSIVLALLAHWLLK